MMEHTTQTELDLAQSIRELANAYSRILPNSSGNSELKKVRQVLGDLETAAGAMYSRAARELGHGV